MSYKVVLINAFKMNYDHQLDFSQLGGMVYSFDASTPDEFITRIQGADAVVTKEYPVPAELIKRFPDSVKLIVEAGTGYNNIDLEAARAKGITVCNIPAYSTERVAHTAIMFILNLASSMGAQIRSLAKGDHSNFTNYLAVPHLEVNGKTLGLVGYGHIAKEIIKVAQALGMHILVSTRTARQDSEGIHFVDFKTLLKESDYISLNCPLNDTTKHMINAEALKQMKATAFLINTGRGSLIDEKALIKALQEGTIAGAGLDVQEEEPPVSGNPLYAMENVILTPHMGWKGLETRQRLVRIIADDVKAFFKGQPINVVS
ncbi:MAG: NAD(P)-dependent oxidoreductase [Veillonellaceae bacterium]|nr:NAD(P)-dependent oxidoreductase [Veillonellaceae bacterium]